MPAAWVVLSTLCCRVCASRIIALNPVLLTGHHTQTCLSCAPHMFVFACCLCLPRDRLPLELLQLAMTGWRWIESCLFQVMDGQLRVHAASGLPVDG